MSDDLTQDQVIGELVKRAHQSLDGLDPARVSPPALAVLSEKITEYIADLINESEANSKRDRTQSISVKHVEAASDYLVTHAGGQIYQHLGTWGGIFLGFSLSAFWSMLQSHQFTNTSVLIGALAAIAGAFLLGLSLRAR